MVRSSVALSFLGVLGLTVLSNFVEIPANTNLFVTSFLTIYVGSHRRLVQMEVSDYVKNATDTRAKTTDDATRATTTQASDFKGDMPSHATQSEHFSTKDAYMFPVTGSMVLLGLYAVFKMFDKFYVNMLLKFYFLLLGVFAMSATLHPFAKDVAKALLKPRRFQKVSKVHKFEKSVPLLEYVTDEKLEIEGDLILAACSVVSTVIAAWYLYSKHWCFNNILGICFSVQAIENIGLGSVKVGIIALVGLFFYDIFWVFGTDVMVTVATKFDAPIKLLFPRALATDDSAAVLQMLGLGDIVMPGLFIALLLRYDFHKAAGIGTRSMSGNEQLSKRETMAFDKPYFNICILAYVMGLILTVFVMYTFKHAQPALLYLVPACLGAGVVTAIARGELFAFLSFSEEVEEKDPKQKE